MNNPVGTTKVPGFHESSSQRTQRDSDSLGRTWIKGRTLAGQVESLIKTVVTQDRILKQLQRRILGGGSGSAGWQFQQPDIELDVTVTVTAGTVVYISGNNPLLSGTYFDAVSLLNVASRGGLWVATKSVPPAVVVTSGTTPPPGTYYNIPQIPYPGATGGSYSGHPWTGDLDGAGVFWAFISEVPYC